MLRSSPTTPVPAPPAPPPGPRRFAVLGLLPRLRDPLGLIQHLIDRHGDVVGVGPKLFALVWRPEHVEHVLATHQANYVKGDSVQIVRPVLGDGLATADGELWLRQRRLVQPSFQRSEIAGFHAAAVAAVDSMLQRWLEKAARREPIDVTADMLALSQTITARSLFGGDLPRQAELNEALEIVEDQIDRKAWNPFAWLERIPTRRNRRYHTALATLEEALHGCIQRAAADDAPSTCVLARLLAARDGGHGMSDRQLRDELMTIFFTGVGTTAFALSWAFYLLGDHAEAAERIRDEAEHAFGSDIPCAGDVARLEFTGRVFDEAVRLYPPAWILARMAVDDDVLGGYHVPKGRAVLLSPYVTHRHPSLWDRPDAFDPDRFAPDRAARRPAFAYYPFGGGPRICVGRHFARHQGRLVLGRVLQRLRALPAAVPPVPRTATVLRPRGALRLGFEPWTRP